MNDICNIVAVVTAIDSFLKMNNHIWCPYCTSVFDNKKGLSNHLVTCCNNEFYQWQQEDLPLYDIVTQSTDTTNLSSINNNESGIGMSDILRENYSVAFDDACNDANESSEAFDDSCDEDANVTYVADKYDTIKILVDMEYNSESNNDNEDNNGEKMITDNVTVDPNSENLMTFPICLEIF